MHLSTLQSTHAENLSNGPNSVNERAEVISSHKIHIFHLQKRLMVYRNIFRIQHWPIAQ